MTKTINFQRVAYNVRFSILSGLKMKTPAEFSAMPEDEKQEHYQAIFDVMHDACNYLSCYLDIEDLNEKYNND